MLNAVMLDSREPPWVQSLKFDGAPTAVATLDYGDLWATTEDGAMLCIERKTPSDLLNSIVDNRLFAQVAGIRAKTQWAYLIITGILRADADGKVIADRPTGWAWDNVQGVLLTVQELGVGIVHTADDAGYEAAVLRLSKRKREEVRIVEQRLDSRVAGPGECVLTSLPGIGWQRAQDLLRVFDGNVGQALAWLTWTNTFGDGPAGIGGGVKAGVRKALNLADSEELYCWGREDFEYYERHKGDAGNKTQIET